MSFWGMAAFFNPVRSVVRLANFRRFAAASREQGLKLLVVELAYHGHEISPSECDKLIQRSSGAVLWQKERLFEIGRLNLPRDCDKVAWLDSDVMFSNADWIFDARKVLDRNPLGQLFEEVQDGETISMGIAKRQRLVGPGPGRTVRRIVAGTPADSEPVCFGHPGYAWAARRELLDKHGFYDRCVIGGGDAVMAWAAYGLEWPGPRMAPHYFSAAHLADIAAWSEHFYQDVQGNVGYVPGRIVHLPHGVKQQRQYAERTQILKSAEFSPKTDLRNLQGEPWLWNSGKAAMHTATAAYFQSRGE